MKTADEQALEGIVNGTTRITNGTTFGEFSHLRGKYGTHRVTFEFGAGLLRPVFAIVVASGITARGRGDTEAEAIDDAFSRLRQRVEIEIWRDIFFEVFFDIFFDVTSNFDLHGGRIVKLFPDHWANLKAGLPVVPTPVGRACAGCGRPFDKNDRGLLLPHVGEIGNRVAELPWHQECFLDAIGIDA